ncbi:MAG TPA: restriction endonuclease [Thermoanaerobaculia bacterium]|nr:restriction endonuclease [Thermoanaerobaculia bacterium]
MDATRRISELPLDSERKSSIIDIPDQVPPDEIASRLIDRDFAVAIVVLDTGDTKLSAEVVRRTAVINAIPAAIPPARFLVTSRSDRSLAPSDELLRDLARRYNFERWVPTSSREGSGIQELRTAILESVAARVLEDKPENEVTRVVRTMTETLCKLIAKNPQVIDEIEWRDLERVVALALQRIGFEVELTPPAKDGGKDVVATFAVRDERKVFYVEVKHWRSGDRPGLRHVTDFIEVNATDGTDGGLFLSSSGFVTAVHGRLAEISAQRVRLGQRGKIVHLCQQFVKSTAGVWRSASILPALLFEETLE